jgi:peroxiredoxin
VVAITYDSAEVLKQAAAKRGMTFLLLSDPGSKTIQAFGVLNQEATGRAKGVAYPGVFILDQQGTIRSKLSLENYRGSPATPDLIRALKEVR